MHYVTSQVERASHIQTTIIASCTAGLTACHLENDTATIMLL